MGMIVYKCSKCGQDYWLYRKAGAFADDPLLCGVCLLRQGYRAHDTHMVSPTRPTYIPAVRTPNGEGFYAYTAVPDTEYIRWLAEDMDSERAKDDKREDEE